MDPQVWSRIITDHLEIQGIVGSILHRGASDAEDRYQPNRVFVQYAWSGQLSATTMITFRIPRTQERGNLDYERQGWRVSGRAAIDSWGDQWEDVTIEIPSGSPVVRAEELHFSGRFRIRISIEDNLRENGVFLRQIVLENLREAGGILYAIRIRQLNLPDLIQLRPFGIEEDIYYRAGGLVGTLDAERNELLFAPFALLPEPIRRPIPGPPINDAVHQGILHPQIADILRERGIAHLWKFQADTMPEIHRRLRASSTSNAMLLTGGTAVGKTEAFLMPLLETLVEDSIYNGVIGIFVYPTKALEGDQAQRFFEYLSKFNEGREHKISIGILDGDTPFNLEQLMEKERQGELRTPFSECPHCTGQIRLSIDLDGSQLDMPKCLNCDATFPWLRLHRKAIQNFWPHLLLTVPDMLHRQISNKYGWMNQAMLGSNVHKCDNCGKYTAATRKTLSRERQCDCGEEFGDDISLCPAMIVFDEAHLLKGLFGSQVAILIARIKKIASNYGHNPLIIGASATISNADDFGLHLFGEQVSVITGQEQSTSDDPPTRYHLFIMPVQVTVLNTVGHILTGCFHADQQSNETNRILVFSDSKRTVYQLEASLPEFYATIPREILPGGIDSAPTRSHTGDHSPEERRGVETAFDQGDLRVLLATQTLEVGVDFRNLQLEIQTGATYSYNDYIQRVGRAGRRGVPALVMCILRPQVPLDYYYYEHCRELVNFSTETLDDIPLRTDNPFLVNRHIPAAIQDLLIYAEPGARLMWDSNSAARLINERRHEVQNYLNQIFIRQHSWDVDLIQNAIDQGIERTLSVLESHSTSNATNDRLTELIELSIRATDIGVPIESDDFFQHRDISLSGELQQEEVEEAGGTEAEDEDQE